MIQQLDKAWKDARKKQAEERKAKQALNKTGTKKKATIVSQSEVKQSGEVGDTSPSEHNLLKDACSTQSAPTGATDQFAASEEPIVDDEAPCCLHPDDPAHFLKLSAALRCFMQTEIDDEDISRGTSLLHEYVRDIPRVSNHIAIYYHSIR